MLTDRQKDILQIIVNDYISTVQPVGSVSIADRYGLSISSATVRNEMARLEEEGYITRRHVSGGGIPSDKGYRYYVESQAYNVEVPDDEQLMLLHLFHQVERELEEWTHLAAALLARMVNNVAMVTFPKAGQCRVKHLELVALQESLAILLLLLHEAKIRQQLIIFDEGVSQEELSLISRELNDMLCGLAWPQIVTRMTGPSLIQGRVKDAVVQLMVEEDEKAYEEPYIEGMRHMLAQPEFEPRQDMLRIMEVLESRDVVRSLIPVMLVEDGVSVVIGDENREDAMRGCSMVMTRYGIPGEVDGALGVIGPTRMHYGRAISAVRYMGSLMSELVSELHAGRDGSSL
jgi:heat-inducible transcriptional repressor